MAFRPPTLLASPAIEAVVVPVPRLLNASIMFLSGVLTSCCGPWEVLRSILGQSAAEPGSRDVPAFAHRAISERDEAEASACWSTRPGSSWGRRVSLLRAPWGVWCHFDVGFKLLPRLGWLQAAAFSFAGAFAQFRSLFVRNFTSPVLMISCWLSFYSLFKPCFGFHLSGSQMLLFGAFFTAVAMSVFI